MFYLNSETVLFDKFTYAFNYITTENIAEWNEMKTDIDQWVEVLQHLKSMNITNIRKVIEFTFYLPGSNAVIERELK